MLIQKAWIELKQTITKLLPDKLVVTFSSVAMS